MYWEVRQLVTAAITPIISFLDWGSFCVSEPRVIQITCGRPFPPHFFTKRAQNVEWSEFKYGGHGFMF